MDARQLEIGGESVTIGVLRSFKAVVALKIIGGVTAQVRQMFRDVAKAQAEYAETNKVVVTREHCIQRAAGFKAAAAALREQLDKGDLPDGVTEDELRVRVTEFDARAQRWDDQLHDMGDLQFVEYPGELPPHEEILAGIPAALGMYDQLVQLIGLAIIPESDLKTAWRTDAVFAALQERGEDMLEKAEAGEEVELLLAVREVIDEQLRPRREALQKLKKLYSRQQTPETEETTEEAETPTTSSPTSSTPSPAPTDGTPSESSSGSRTQQTSLSPAA